MGFLNAAHMQFLFDGLLWTVGLSLIAFAGGGALGFLVALGSSYGPRWSRLLVSLYVKLIQGTPLLVLLPLVYFGLPSLGLNIAPLAAAGIALSVYVSAYLGEIWRGCLASVPRTQASAIGFVELARAGQIINNSTFEPFVIFMIVAALYFALCYPLSVLSRRLERSFHVANR